jgi:hypothetical protein
VQEAQLQLQLETGWSDSSSTLFAHCCLLFVPIDLSQTAAAGTGVSAAVAVAAAGASAAAAAAPVSSSAPSTRGDNGIGSSSSVILFGCAVKAQQLAAAWHTQLAEQQLTDVKLSVMLHGGAVAESYGPNVTHIVLWPIMREQEQQQRAWLLSADAAQIEAADWDRPSGVLNWPQELLPQLHEQQQLQVSASLLLRQLASVAEVAAVAATSAAAAAAAAAVIGGKGGSGLVRVGRKKGRFGPAPPDSSTAAAGAGGTAAAAVSTKLEGSQAGAAASVSAAAQAVGPPSEQQQPPGECFCVCDSLCRLAAITYTTFRLCVLCIVCPASTRGRI